jgi:cytochrome c oxidase assembly protein subunit 15
MKLRRALYGVLLVLQAGLVLTGGAVRLTGSGLGCPTWPECTPGSYTPVPNQAEGQLHAWIEFGNRLLTFALVAVALAVLVHVLFKKRRESGVTRIKQAEKMTANLSRAHIYLTFLVIALGTLVTGSGPHAGDEDSRRFGFDIRTVASIHAEAVIALLGLTLALYVAARTNPLHRRRLIIFTAISLAQGAIGYIQYFTGIPEILVAAHLLGSTLVWISAWRLRLAITTSPVRIQISNAGESS